MFPAAGGPALTRYAAVFDFVEINASFYRPFRAETYAKWALETPDGFRFAVKMPRTITHFTRLQDPLRLGPFFAQVSALGDKLAAVLVQLPPSLSFDAAVAGLFFTALRESYAGGAVCEPRHPSWTGREAAGLLAAHEIGQVCTTIPEPARVAGPAGIPVYVRLHGAPRKYYSAYRAEQLASLARFLRLNRRRRCFVVFDNTAGGAAVRNALDLRGRLAFAGGRKGI